MLQHCFVGFTKLLAADNDGSCLGAVRLLRGKAQPDTGGAGKIQGINACLIHGQGLPVFGNLRLIQLRLANMHGSIRGATRQEQGAKGQQQSCTRKFMITHFITSFVNEPSAPASPHR